ncbi:adenylosuccinate lyase [Calditrichota bacterium]
MIERYKLPEIGNIWSDENRFSIWLKIEILATRAQANLGLVPLAAIENIEQNASFNVTRILEIEEEVKHDVIAFLTNVAEYVGEDSRYIHYGMTSSDILDTCLSVQMVESSYLIKSALQELINTLKTRASETKHMVMIGRSHGVHAEPITFGLKLALWYDELNRQLARLENAIETVRVGQISGAVGTYDHLSPDVEKYVCEQLGLKPASISTQILQRDRHANFMNTIALIGASFEKIAVEIRHLQRTEVLEAEEYFSKGQKGSSAMPHKKNPIVCERISGMARLLRGNALAAMENVALWHERDISHSSVERIIIPDSTMTLYYMTKKMIDLISNLVIHPDKMLENLNLTRGLIYSQAVLLALTQKGVSREESYRLVQRNAMRVWDEKISFEEALIGDSQIKNYLDIEEIRQICSIENRLKM